MGLAFSEVLDNEPRQRLFGNPGNQGALIRSAFQAPHQVLRCHLEVDHGAVLAHVIHVVPVAGRAAPRGNERPGMLLGQVLQHRFLPNPEGGFSIFLEQRRHASPRDPPDLFIGIEKGKSIMVAILRPLVDLPAPMYPTT